MSHRLAELGLTALGLAAAGALGVYVAIHAMEGTLAAAIAPRAVVADLSPALPASQIVPVVAPSASAVPASASVLPPVAFTKPIALPQATHAAPLPALVHRPQPKASTLDRAVVADAKRDTPTSVQGAGLFDDSN